MSFADPSPARIIMPIQELQMCFIQELELFFMREGANPIRPTSTPDAYCSAASVLAPVKRHCNIELIFGVGLMLHFKVVRCMHSRREIMPPHPIRLRQTTLKSWREYCRPKIVPFPAALAADMAVIGFREAENPELAACT